MVDRVIDRQDVLGCIRLGFAERAHDINRRHHALILLLDLVFEFELGRPIHVVGRAAEDETEVDGNEGRFERHEARIERVVDVALEGRGLLSLVDAEPYHVMVIIQNGVEIAQEDSAEAIFVLHAHQFLNADLTPLLILVHLISVATGPQLDIRLLKVEADRFQLLSCDITRLVSLHCDGAIEILQLVEAYGIPTFVLLSCVLEFSEHIVKDGGRQLDRRVCRVNYGNLGTLARRAVDAVVHKVVDHQSPVVAAEI